MDPLTHGLIGAVLSTLSGHTLQLQDPVFLGCTLGSMIPDLDIVAHYKGRLNYLLKHRSVSHSLIAFTVMSLVLSTILYLIFPATSWSSIFLWTLVGTLSHGLMDVLNSYGAELLWPFVRKKFTVNMIMLTDPVVFFLFLVSLITSYSFTSMAQITTLMTIILAAIYLAFREKGRLKIRNNLRSVYHQETKSEVIVLPAMYHPFSWNFILLQSDCVLYGTIKDKNPVILRVLPQWDSADPLVMAALEGNLAELFDQFTPYYHLVTQQSINNICKIEFLDLRYWSKGNFLYSGQLNINEKGEITQEKFYLSPDRDGIFLSY
jgi:inner membrane protein